MTVMPTYSPFDMFAPPAGTDRARPRVFIAPPRYIQGRGVLHDTGRYLSLLPARHVALLMSERGHRTAGRAVAESLRAAGVSHVARTFNGECSLEEIEAHAADLEGERIDALIAAGGGKCIDAGKSIAYRLDIPVVIAPTLASNDAPCSALSVIYTADGAFAGGEFFPDSPALVIVDTQVVAEAPERYLVAGIGDAMATWYEARVCLVNDTAMNAVGARPTLASGAIGETCCRTLFDQGTAAAAAVRDRTVNDALEAVVEANTLLSGLGFESGGLAAAHGVAQSYTAIPKVESNFLHGELVAMGTLAQLMLESRPDEATRVAEFFARVGLPVHLGQLLLDGSDMAALETVVEGTLAFPFIGNMPEPVTADGVRSALLDAHALGLSVCGRVGDASYRQLRDA